MRNEVKFVERNELAPSVWEYCFTATEPLDFVAGQYVKLRFSDDTAMPGRTFTITSKPGDVVLSFIVRFPSPMSDYKHRLQALQPRDSMQHDDPMGDAILPRALSTPLIFIAQGIALASYISILRECKELELPYEIQVLWVRRDSDNAIASTIEPYLTKHVELSEHNHRALISMATIRPLLQENTLIYISGSQGFVESVGADIEAAGILRERIVYDYYEGYETL